MDLANNQENKNKLCLRDVFIEDCTNFHTGLAVLIRPA